jgi:hypothetical protein
MNSGLVAANDLLICECDCECEIQMLQCEGWHKCYDDLLEDEDPPSCSCLLRGLTRAFAGGRGSASYFGGSGIPSFDAGN